MEKIMEVFSSLLAKLLTHLEEHMPYFVWDAISAYIPMPIDD